MIWYVIYQLLSNWWFFMNFSDLIILSHKPMNECHVIWNKILGCLSLLKRVMIWQENFPQANV